MRRNWIIPRKFNLTEKVKIILFPLYLREASKLTKSKSEKYFRGLLFAHIRIVLKNLPMKMKNTRNKDKVAKF